MAAAAEAPEQQRAYYYPAQAPMPSVTLPGALPREELYRQFDFNQDGRVSRAEFVHGMKSLQAGGPVGTLVYGPGYTGDALPPAAAEAMARHGLSADAVAAAQHAASTGGARMGGAGSSSSQHAMGSGWGAGGAAAWDAAGGNQRPIWAQNGAGGSGFGGCPARGIGAGQTGGPGGGLGGYLGGGPGGFVGGPCGGPGGLGGGPCGSPGGFGGGPCSGPGGFGGGGPGGAPGAGIGGGYPGTPGAGSSGDGLTSDTVERLAPIRVPLRKPKYPGGKVFYGDVPSDSATFAYSELCATPDPEAALAPTPQIPVKKWYNTYLYVPEERRAIKDGGQFMERFVQGPDGEWLDVPKARRMAQHIEDSLAPSLLPTEAMHFPLIASLAALLVGTCLADSSRTTSRQAACFEEPAPQSGAALLQVSRSTLKGAQSLEHTSVYEEILSSLSLDTAEASALLETHEQLREAANAYAATVAGQDGIAKQSAARHLIERARETMSDKAETLEHALAHKLLWGSSNGSEHEPGSMECSKCGFVYKPSENNGVAFEALPDDWKCPNCGAPKSSYKKFLGLWVHTHGHAE